MVAAVERRRASAPHVEERDRLSEIRGRRQSSSRLSGIQGVTRGRETIHHLRRRRPRGRRTTVRIKLALFVGGCVLTSTLSIGITLFIKGQFEKTALVAEESHSRHRQQQKKRLRRTIVPRGSIPQHMMMEDPPLQNSHHVRPAESKQNNKDDDAISLLTLTKSDTHPKKPKDQKNWLSPKLSHPPEAMARTMTDDDTRNSTIVERWPDWKRRRWKCLQHIRHWQATTVPKGVHKDPSSSPLISLSTWLHGSDNNDNDQASRPLHNILLVDPAYHANVGDHMITLGEQVYIQKQLLPSLHSHPTTTGRDDGWDECSFFQAGPWAPPCDDVIANLSSSLKPNQKLLALWHGGGNWGDLWDTIHTVRTASLRTLLRNNFTIVGMPQSLYFANQKAERLNANDIRQAIVAGLGLHGRSGTEDNQIQEALRGRLLLTWREQASLDRARLLYPYIQHTLLPDIAFQLGPFDATALRANQGSPPPRVDVLFLLRDDHESLYGMVRDRKSIRRLLSDNPRTARFTYSVVDWPDRLDRFDSNDYYFTNTAIQLLDMGNVVICDRLHAAILAYLSGIPFVYVDQVSGKISKTLGVAMQSHKDCQKPALYERAENIVDAIDKAASLWQKGQAPRPS